MYRIAAFDVGNITTGYVVADVSPDETGTLTIKTMGVMNVPDGFDTKQSSQYIIDQSKEHVLPLLASHERPVVLYENVFYTPKAKYRNMKVVNMNKALKKFFESKRMFVRSLKSSQKVGIKPGTKHDQRKKQAEKAAKGFMDAHWLEVFNEHERCHDIADAILMVAYVRKNPDIIEKAGYTLTTK